jgi:hypothetical protein
MGVPQDIGRRQGRARRFRARPPSERIAAVPGASGWNVEAWCVAPMAAPPRRDAVMSEDGGGDGGHPRVGRGRTRAGGEDGEPGDGEPGHGEPGHPPQRGAALFEDTHLDAGGFERSPRGSRSRHQGDGDDPGPAARVRMAVPEKCVSNVRQCSARPQRGATLAARVTVPAPRRWRRARAGSGVRRAGRKSVCPTHCGAPSRVGIGRHLFGY